MKRFILVGTAILVIAGLYTGKTMAKNRVSAYVDKTVTTSSLDLSLCVSGAGIDDKGNMQTNGINTIDDTIEQRVSVLNSGEKAQYVRVKISKDNWVNINLINKDDWIVPDNHTDSENVYVYYNKVLNPGERTPELMDSIILKILINHYEFLSCFIKCYNRIICQDFNIWHCNNNYGRYYRH